MADDNPTTKPVDKDGIVAHVLDDDTGAIFVHKDLWRAREDWAVEEHIGPIDTKENFGDVESWCDYVSRYCTVGALLATWNSKGLKAVLDYHQVVDGVQGTEANRCQWLAVHDFAPSRQWRAWTAFANGQPHKQAQAIERLEDLGEDIIDPDTAKLMDILRALRANVTATASTRLEPDGSYSVQFSKDATVRGGGESALQLPQSLTIAIPVLQGHTDKDGKPVKYQLGVRLRVFIGDDAHLSLRFSIPLAEKVWEEVVAEQVAKAQERLALPLLRAAE